MELRVNKSKTSMSYRSGSFFFLWWIRNVMLVYLPWSLPLWPLEWAIELREHDHISKLRQITTRSVCLQKPICTSSRNKTEELALPFLFLSFLFVCLFFEHINSIFLEKSKFPPFITKCLLFHLSFDLFPILQLHYPRISTLYLKILTFLWFTMFSLINWTF